MDTVIHLAAQLSAILAIAYLIFEARRWERATGRRLVCGLLEFFRGLTAGAVPRSPLAAVAAAGPALLAPAPAAAAADATGETRDRAAASRGEIASSARPNAALILLATLSAVAIAAALLDAGSRRPRPDPGPARRQTPSHPLAS